MTILFQSHSGREKAKGPSPLTTRIAPLEARPEVPDIAVDEQADFGYFVPPLDAPENYLPASQTTVDELDELGNLMIEAGGAGGADSTMPPVLTYWGQFLDHELTARTDRETEISKIENAHPPVPSSAVESSLRNARTPRFDLDSVYGGSPIGPDITADVATVISGLRHPTLRNKMCVGTSVDPVPLPDGLDEHRDLPRYVQVQPAVRNAALRVAQASLSPSEFDKFSDTLPQRALIGDMRNDENLVVAQFHLSFLRFHNRVIDFLESHDTGWIPDFASAQTLTRLHYQWLAVEGYLKGVCDPAVVNRVIHDRASHFFKFRAEFDSRRQNTRLGNALPLEFSLAGYRFGHSMVRGAYDYNKNFGPEAGFAPRATLNDLFEFTGGGGAINTSKRLPKIWVIDWARFVDASAPPRVARKIDTALAPPLNDMIKEGNDKPEPLRTLLRSLARRNLRRGYNLRLPSGQAFHRYLNQIGAVQSAPIADVSTIFGSKPQLRDFLKNSQSKFHERTPLWFYILAEAESGGGNRLGEVGSFLVASTFIGVLLADPDSALSRGFHPNQSPLRMDDNTPIDSIAKWMRFASVME
jgi:Animal haem peroxidase